MSGVGHISVSPGGADLLDRLFRRFYPASLDLRGQRVVVCGGGDVAARKMETLLACGAMVTVISPELTPRLRTLVDQRRLSWMARTCRPEDVRDARLVFACTDQPAVNQAMAEAARQAGAWVNVVDAPERCSLFVPAVLHRGALSVTVSTDGHSPALAAHIRDVLAEQIGPEYGDLVTFLGQVRTRLAGEIADAGVRQRIHQRLANANLAPFFRSGDIAGAESAVAVVVREETTRG